MCLRCSSVWRFCSCCPVRGTGSAAVPASCGRSVGLRTGCGGRSVMRRLSARARSSGFLRPSSRHALQAAVSSWARRRGRPDHRSLSCRASRSVFAPSRAWFSTWRQNARSRQTAGQEPVLPSGWQACRVQTAGLFLPGFAVRGSLYGPGLPEGWVAMNPPSLAKTHGRFDTHREWLTGVIEAQHRPVSLADRPFNGRRPRDLCGSRAAPSHRAVALAFPGRASTVQTDEGQPPATDTTRLFKACTPPRRWPP